MKRAAHKTTGLVLRRFNLGEADRVITFVTPDRGKVRAVARGVRRITSKLAGHLELFGEVTLMLVPGRQFEVVTSARLQRHPEDITSDYEKLGQAYLWAEMLDKLTPEDEAQPELYQLAREVFGELGRVGTEPVLGFYFDLNLLAGLGYRPHLDGCVVCGTNREGVQYWFSPELGGVVDQACYRGGAERISVAQIKFWRLAQSLPLERLRTIVGAGEAAAQSQLIMSRFYEYLFGRRFAANGVLRTQV